MTALDSGRALMKLSVCGATRFLNASRSHSATVTPFSVKADSESAWSQVAPAFQSAFLRIRAHPAVAEVDRNQCLECHVTVTSSGMQGLRKGEQVVQCENCGRILVMA